MTATEMARQEKPKSAPAIGQRGASRSDSQRRGSVEGKRWVSIKSNAVKEVEAWATEGREKVGVEVGRHSGQLMDNVTEERMLQSKLWDLARERHKFLSQTDYERKMFLEKMQRKSHMMRVMLDGVEADGKRTAWSDQAKKVRSNCQGSGNARIAFLDRMDPSKNKDRSREVETSTKGSKQRSQSSLGHNKKSHTAPPPPASPRDPTDPVFRTELSNTKLPEVTPLQPPGVRFSDQAPTRPHLNIHRTMSLRAPRASMRMRTGPAADPRYVNLEDSLSSNYHHHTKAGVLHVPDLIQKVDALNIPPKRPTDSRPRISRKIQAFMQEKGLAF